MEIISLRGVKRVFDGKTALEDVNWTVNSGEHWSILGLNGSGKTTLLKIASGRLWPTQGQVRILGGKTGSFDLRRMRESIGWVSSHLLSRIGEGLTVEEIILSGKYDSIGLYRQANDADKNKASGLMGLLGLEGFGNRPFQTLSQGEKQKTLLGRALMPEPQLLIMDEPCAGLDMKTQKTLQETLQKIMSQTPATIYVTHHIEEINPKINKTLLLKGGKTIAQGDKTTTLTSENLSKTLEMPVKIEEHQRRYYLKTQ
jgi:iron complex transport system ATP-binding protein